MFDPGVQELLKPDHLIEGHPVFDDFLFKGIVIFLIPIEL
jgi:hypothetical protein